MSQQKLVKVGDRLYDAHTGLPIDARNNPSVLTTKTQHEPAQKRQSHAGALHVSASKSRTLHRSAVTRPAASPQPKKSATLPVITKSSHIQRFAPTVDGIRPKSSQTAQTPRNNSSDVRPHVGVKTHTQQTVVTKQPKKAAEIKHDAIETALKHAKTPSSKPLKTKKRSSRIVGSLAAGLAVLLIAGYVSYLTMPSLSLRVAAAQAGLDASYPQYHPDGYRPGGAITFAPGEVNIPFSANGDKTAYTLTQKKSNWDSTAVKEYVEEETNGTLAYTTETERGVTIYSYNGNAAWVNRGVLYTITGDANLSNDQIRRIAASL